MELTTATPPKTLTKKRRHSEYHDPDYGSGYDDSNIEGTEHKRIKQDDKNIPSKNVTSEGSPSGDGVDQMKRIKDIVRLEFHKELTFKEHQLTEIDSRLLQARHLLDKLRYQVVSEYYKKQQVPLTAPDVSKVRSSDTLFGDGLERSGAQLPLHPAIKKIVGKRPSLIQLHLPERSAATLAKQSIRLRNPAHRRAERRRLKKIREQGIVTDHSQEKGQHTEASCDEQPCTSKQAYERQLELDASVSALNASRLNNKNKFHFVVGNTSKYVGGEDVDGRGNQSLVYKWLAYVQGKNLPQPPEAYIKKVRFQLHHSYRPNDIVDVHTPPFQLTRRGWGEFPIRIQLYFQDHLQQKPVQLMHNIVLDKTMCGLHTMGGETTVEVWLRAEAAPETTTSRTPPKVQKREMVTPNTAPLKESFKPRTISITQNKEELDDNLFAGINKIELSDDIEQIEPTVLVSEPLKLSSPKKLAPAAVSPRTYPHAPAGHNLPMNGSICNKIQHWRNGHAKTQTNNVVFQKAGKLYIIDPLQTKLKRAVKQQSLLKPQLSLLKQQQLSKRWHFLQCIQHDHGYANMSSHEFLPTLTTLPQRQHLTLEQIFNGIQFQSMRSAVEFLFRRLPLTGAINSEYAFGNQSMAAFLAQPVLRQRFYEYMRGRTISRCMRQHTRLQHLHASGKECFWSVREIVSFARLHGYTPPLKMLSICRQKANSEAAANFSQRVQQQLKDEPQPQLQVYCSLSGRNRLDSWLSAQTAHLPVSLQQTEEQELVDVLTVDVARRKINRWPAYSLNKPNNHQMLYIPPPENLETAVQLVRDMCRDVGIVLDTEQSVPGVSQSLAVTLLAHVMRMFVEQLVRRSVAAKLQHQQQQSSGTEALTPVAANTDLCLLPSDIGRVISKCAELDFLGNCNLGVPHMDNHHS